MYILIYLLSKFAFAELLCTRASLDSEFAIGDRVPICLFFSAVPNANTAERVFFEPKVDEYSGIQASGVYEKFQNRTIYLRIQAGEGEISDPVPYIDPNKELVGVVYSAVVILDHGEIDKIEWDNDCGPCSDCLELNDEEVCGEDLCDPGSYEDCDPKIYVSWMGTDSNGLALVSAGYRISQFRKFSLFEVYKEAKSNF
jgi:hypothetical protein